MKTDFHILWIDDNKDAAPAARPHLEKWLDEQGFGLHIHAQKTAAGAVELLKEKDIALVALDYHLGKKEGDDIIKDFRSKGLYQDIIFYSENFGGDSFDQLDGVFKVVRTDVEKRIKDLLDLRIRAVSEFATFRGWFVADCIELEVILGRLLTKFFGNQQTRFKQHVLDREHLFDFYKKHMVLCGLIDDRVAELNAIKEDTTSLAACRLKLKKFPDEIIHQRNALAHQPSDTGEIGKHIKAPKAAVKEITEDPKLLGKMRKAVRDHHANLLRLEELI